MDGKMRVEEQNASVFETMPARPITDVRDRTDIADSGSKTVIEVGHDTEIPESWTRGLNKIANLRNGWDSYEGQSISQEILDVTKELLVVLYRNGMPQPHIMPGGDNTVQVEFDNLDFEIYIESPNSVEVEHSSHIFNIGNDYSKLGQYIANKKNELIG